MYSLIARTVRLARKPHTCIWCGEYIEAGTTYVHEISKYEAIQNHRWHLECEQASDHYPEEEFAGHGYQRGSTEER